MKSPTLARSASQGNRLSNPRNAAAPITIRCCFASILLASLACNALADDRPFVLVVVGAEGAPEYGKQFHQWAERWEWAAKQGQADHFAIGLQTTAEKADRELLQERLTALAQPAMTPAWLILIGHGTFDGKTARFNLRGPDITSADLAVWVKPIRRPLVILNSASSSGPFLNELSAPGRIVITAGRSGFEYNFARFGDYLSAAIADPKADLDKDEQVSLLEAFLRASAGVEEFYKREARLATEHALLDDNGDKLGTAADWFQGVRAVKSAKDGASPDGLRASQVVLVKSRSEDQLSPEVRARRDALERELAAIRDNKGKLVEEEYLKLLEPVLIELARLYETAGQ